MANNSSANASRKGCYAAGSTYIEAAERSLKKLADDGLYSQEVLQPIHEMELQDWSTYMAEAWPDHVASLPSQSEFERVIRSGRVVYGHFGSYT